MLYNIQKCNIAVRHSSQRRWPHRGSALPGAVGSSVPVHETASRVIRSPARASSPRGLASGRGDHSGPAFAATGLASGSRMRVRWSRHQASLGHRQHDSSSNCGETQVLEPEPHVAVPPAGSSHNKVLGQADFTKLKTLYNALTAGNYSTLQTKSRKIALSCMPVHFVDPSPGGEKNFFTLIVGMILSWIFVLKKWIRLAVHFVDQRSRICACCLSVCFTYISEHQNVNNFATSYRSSWCEINRTGEHLSVYQGGEACRRQFC